MSIDFRLPTFKVHSLWFNNVAMALVLTEVVTKLNILNAQATSRLQEPI